VAEKRTDQPFVEQKRGRVYFTYFTAWGSLGEDLRDWGGEGSPGVLEVFATDLGYKWDVPGGFYSQSVIGQVKWDGVVRLEGLIAELNSLLQFGTAREGFDFRRFYPQWGYTYRIREGIGGTFRDIAVKYGGLDSGK
jgi:hypothetical protein